MEIYAIAFGAFIIGFILGRVFEAASKTDKRVITDIQFTKIPSKEAEDKIKAFVRQGQKIEALKHLREATGLSLKESKEMVDSIFETGNCDIRSLIEQH